MNVPATLVLAGVLPLAAASPGESPGLDVALARQYFDEIKVLSETDAAALWGMELYGPIIFADPVSRQVVANQADGEGRLAARDGVFVGRLPDAVNISNTAIHWAGIEWTMVVWPLPTDKTARATLMAHELWHRIQDDLGIAMANPGNAHLATADGRIWMQLEWRALRKALVSSGDDERSAIEDALAFRAHRRSVFREKVSEENALELNEGLAEYTGIALASGEAKGRRSQAAEALKQAGRRESFTRSFAYASGPAYGLLLDAHAPAIQNATRKRAPELWRKSIKDMGDLGAALQSALGIASPPVDSAAILARASKYGGDELIAAERQRETEQKAEIARLRARFLDGPTLRLPLGKSNVSFDPNRNHPLAEGTVYLAARLTDAWGELDAPGGVFVSADWTWASVPLTDASKPATSGEGWSLQIEEGWESKHHDGGRMLSKKK